MNAYGSFFAIWNSFEIVVEILIRRQLRTSYQQTSIICASLGFGAKINILCSLLHDKRGNEKGIKLLRDAQNIAARNSFAHGFIIDNQHTGRFDLIKRDVKDRYKISKKSLSSIAMGYHTISFSEAFSAVTEHFNVSHDQIDRYAHSIAKQT